MFIKVVHFICLVILWNSKFVKLYKSSHQGSNLKMLYFNIYMWFDGTSN